MTTAAVVLGIIFLAGLVEFCVELVFGQFLSGRIMRLIAVIVGLGIGLLFKVGLIASLGISGIDMTTTAAIWADYALTGVIIGAGSTKAHEFFDKFLPQKV